MKIQPLNKSRHNRKKFNSGVDALNNYLNQTARQHDELDISRTYVLTHTENSEDILGFYTLSVCHIRWDELPSEHQKKYPKNGISAAMIGRLAVDKSHQRKGNGAFLLIDAITKIITSGAEVAYPAIIVDAKDEHAKRFYEEFGFEEIAPNSHRLYMPTKYAKTMIDSL